MDKRPKRSAKACQFALDQFLKHPILKQYATEKGEAEHQAAKKLMQILSSLILDSGSSVVSALLDDIRLRIPSSRIRQFDETLISIANDETFTSTCLEKSNSSSILHSKNDLIKHLEGKLGGETTTQSTSTPTHLLEWLGSGKEFAQLILILIHCDWFKYVYRNANLTREVFAEQLLRLIQVRGLEPSSFVRYLNSNTKHKKKERIEDLYQKAFATPSPFRTIPSRGDHTSNRQFEKTDDKE